MNNIPIELLSTVALPIKYLAVFILGIVTSFTPCAYPIIPITVGIFSKAAGESRRRLLMLAITYVLGMAIVYSTLGVIAALSGGLIGSFLGSKVFAASAAILLFTLALFTLDILQINRSFTPAWLQRMTKPTFFGALLMGGGSGFVAAPCVGPILVAVLEIAALSKQPIMGATLLFTYSLGIGLLTIVVALSAGTLAALPKPGDWFNVIKLILGGAIMGLALFVARPLLPGLAVPDTVLYVLGGVGLILIFINVKLPHKLLALIASSLVAFTGVWLTYPPLNAAPLKATKLVWHTELPAALEVAKRENKKVLVDLYADWCVACHEFETKTFSDPKVQVFLSRFVLVRLDFTSKSQMQTEITKKYGVLGLPTLLLLDANGNEIRHQRIEGFMEPKEFIEWIVKSTIAIM